MASSSTTDAQDSKAATAALLQSMPKPVSESARRRETPAFVAETETLHDWHALWYLNAHPAFAADYIARNAQDLLAQTIRNKVNPVSRPNDDVIDETSPSLSHCIMIGPMYDAVRDGLGSKAEASRRVVDFSEEEDPNIDNSITEHDLHHKKKRHQSVVDPLRQATFATAEHVPLPVSSHFDTNTAAYKNSSSCNLSENNDNNESVVQILTQKPKPLPRMLAAVAIGRFAYDVISIDDEDKMKAILPKPFPQKIDHTQRLGSSNSDSFKHIKNRIAAAGGGGGEKEDLIMTSQKTALTSAPAFNRMLLLYPPVPDTMFKPFDCVRTSTDVEMVEENLHEVVFSVCRAVGQMIESEHTSLYVTREDTRGQIYLERRLPFGGMNEKLDIHARNTIASYAADKLCAIAVGQAHQTSSIFPLGIGQRNCEVAQSVISVPLVVVGDHHGNNRLIGVVEYYRSIHLPAFNSALLKHVVKILTATALSVLATPAFDQDKRLDLLTGLHGPSLASTVEDFDEAVNKLLALSKQIIDAEKSYIYFLLPRESYELDAPDGARTYAVKTEGSRMAAGVVHHYFTVSHKVFNYRRRGQGMASALREYAREEIVNKLFDAALTSERSEAKSTLLNFDADYFFNRQQQHRNSSSGSVRHSTVADAALSSINGDSIKNRDVSSSGRESASSSSTSTEAIIPGEKTIRNVIIMPVEHMHNAIGCTPCLLAIVNKRHDPNGFNRFDEHVIRKFTLYCGVILTTSTMQYTNSLNRLYLQTTLDEEAFFLTPTVAEASEFCAQVDKRISALTKKPQRRNNNSNNKSLADEAKFQLPFAVVRIFYKLFLNDKTLTPQLARPQLYNFILSTEKNYQTHTVHHNYQHAVATCQALYAIYRQLPALWNLYTTIEQYALLFACFCHNLDYLYDADHIERFHPRIAGLFTCAHDENDQGRELLQILSKAERNDFMLRTFLPEQRASLLAAIKRYESYTDLLHAPSVVRALEKEYIGGDLYYETDPYIQELLTKLVVLVADLQWTCCAFPQHRQRIREYVGAWLNKSEHLKLYGLEAFSLLGVVSPPPGDTNVPPAMRVPPLPYNIKTAMFESVQSVAGDMASFLRTYVLPCYQMLARVFADLQPWAEAVDANLCAWQLCVDKHLDWRSVTIGELSKFDMQTELRAKRALELQAATMRLDRTLGDDQDSAPLATESGPPVSDADVGREPSGAEAVATENQMPENNMPQPEQAVLSSATQPPVEVATDISSSIDV